MLLGGFYYATKCYRYSEMPLVFATFLKIFIISFTFLPRLLTSVTLHLYLKSSNLYYSGTSFVFFIALSYSCVTCPYYGCKFM